MILFVQVIGYGVFLSDGQMIYRAFSVSGDILLIYDFAKEQIRHTGGTEAGFFVLQHLHYGLLPGVGSVQIQLFHSFQRYWWKPVSVPFLLLVPICRTLAGHHIIKRLRGYIQVFNQSRFQHRFAKENSFRPHFPRGIERGPARKRRLDLFKRKKDVRRVVFAQFLKKAFAEQNG